MTAPPGMARSQQGAQACAGWKGPNREQRRRAIHAIGVMNKISYAEARGVYQSAVLPFLDEMPRNEIEAYLRATFRMDPTGVTAVRNVSREGR